MSKIRVVLIEDHELTRVGIRSALQQFENMEVLGEAANAGEGLKLLEVTKPDIAIVDIGLPDLDGIELTQRVKAAEADKSSPGIKVLILTMQDSEEVVLAAFAAGANSYCMKDASSEKLLEALQVTSEGNPWIDPAIARIVLRHSQKAYTATSPIAKSETVAINRLSAAADGQPIPIYPLTERELDVLKLIVDGCSNAEIAEKLYITVGTVKTHVRNIFNKLSADDRTQVAVRALRTGLVR